MMDSGQVKTGQKMGSLQNSEEVKLIDLFITLLKHKRLIIWMTLGSGVIAAGIGFWMTTIYRSEATIAPVEQEKGSLSSAVSSLGGLGAMFAAQVGIGGAGSIEKFEVVLKSRELTNQLIKKYDLMPIIFYEKWDVKNKRWTTDKTPTIEDAQKVIFGSFLKIKTDKKSNIVKISFEYPDKVWAQRILAYYVEGLSEYLRQQALETARAQKEHLNQQMLSTADPVLKSKLAELTAQQLEKEILAKVQKYYGFNVIDPPFVPEKKSKPKIMQIVLVAATVAFFISMFLSFFLEYLRNIRKNEDPERISLLRKYMKWKIS